MPAFGERDVDSSDLRSSFESAAFHVRRSPFDVLRSTFDVVPRSTTRSRVLDVLRRRSTLLFERRTSSPPISDERRTTHVRTQNGRTAERRPFNERRDGRVRRIHEHIMTDMQLIFEQIRAGGDRNFGYLLGDRDARQGVLIDPSYSPETFVQRATDQGLDDHPHHQHPRSPRSHERQCHGQSIDGRATGRVRGLSAGQSGSRHRRRTGARGRRAAASVPPCARALSRSPRALRADLADRDHRRSAVRRQGRRHDQR